MTITPQGLSTEKLKHRRTRKTSTDTRFVALTKLNIQGIRCVMMSNAIADDNKTEKLFQQVPG